MMGNNHGSCKIGFIASSGGHWEELMCLKEIAKTYNSFFVTEEGGQAKDTNLQNIYILKQINRRENAFIIHFIKLFIESVKILRKEKPDYIITTGALIAYPFCVLSKIFKIKVIYIESFARIENCSLTGKLVYPLADLFLVQWETMLRFYPKAKYVGGIF